MKKKKQFSLFTSFSREIIWEDRLLTCIMVHSAITADSHFIFASSLRLYCIFIYKGNMTTNTLYVLSFAEKSNPPVEP